MKKKYIDGNSYINKKQGLRKVAKFTPAILAAAIALVLLPMNLSEDAKAKGSLESANSILKEMSENPGLLEHQEFMQDFYSAFHDSKDLSDDMYDAYIDELFSKKFILDYAKEHTPDLYEQYMNSYRAYQEYSHSAKEKEMGLKFTGLMGVLFEAMCLAAFAGEKREKSSNKYVVDMTSYFNLNNQLENKTGSDNLFQNAEILGNEADCQALEKGSKEMQR